MTEFYFYLSLSGVLGGSFNALLAPSIFDSLAEYAMIVTATCLLLPWGSCCSSRQSRIKDVSLPAALGLLCLALILILQIINTSLRRLPRQSCVGTVILAAAGLSEVMGPC